MSTLGWRYVIWIAAVAAATAWSVRPFAESPDGSRAPIPRRAAQAGLGRTEANWLVAIGVNRFTDDGVSPLSYAVADAQAIHDFFTSTGYVPDWQAYLLITDSPKANFKPTKNNILLAIKYAAEHAGPDSTIVVSFSGHGFVDEKRRESYLLPEDGSVSLLQDTAVAVARVNELLADSKAQRKIVFVDACRNTPRKAARGDDEPDRTIVFLDDWKKAGAGQVTLAACRSGEVSRELPALEHGIFTHFLLEGLRGKAEADRQGLITLNRLCEYVTVEVPRWCAKSREPTQQPWMWGEMGAPIPLAIASLEPPVVTPTPRPTPIATPTPRPTPRPTPTPRRPDEGRSYTETHAGLKLEMVWVPGGTFEMGSRLSAAEVVKRYGGKEEFFADDHPLHEVDLDGFWLGKFEVTNAQFRKLRPSHSSKDFERHSLDGDDQPAVYVSWDDAKAFCDWLSQNTAKQYCLPTEAQWEYACRAGTTTERYWGDDDETMGQYANVADRTAKTKFPEWGKMFAEHNADFAATDDGCAVSAPVGRFRPNRFGLHDMLGNVWEWCSDGYGPYESGRVRNPTGPASVASRVVRGGSWSNYPYFVRSVDRIWCTPALTWYFGGFRVSRLPSPR